MIQESSPAAHAFAPGNSILAALPAEERERLNEVLEPVDLPHRHVLIEPDRAIEHVYFLDAGVVSVLGLMPDGSAVETATVGNEGFVGVPVYLGAMQMAGQAFMQVPGNGWRMTAGDLREEVRRGSELSRLLGRYTQALFTLLSQNSACNRLHPVEQRCARWLLLTHDRVHGDTFELTQLFLSQMLGVRRPTVTEVAAQLRGRGLIDYTRGRVSVLDRAGLERASCPCYAVIRAEFARMIEGRELPSPLDGLNTSRHGQSLIGQGAVEEETEVAD